MSSQHCGMGLLAMARPKRPHAKLTPEAAAELRRLVALRRQLTNKALAHRFGVSKSAMWRAVSGETWADL
jgi:predicted DNA-binding protein (UPF0251 family)